MYSYAKQSLECDNCHKPLTPEDILSQSLYFAEPLSILHTACHHCAAKLEVEVKQGRLTVGGIDGFPGPCFMALSTEAIEGLSILPSEKSSITIMFAGQAFKVRTTRPNEPLNEAAIGGQISATDQSGMVTRNGLIRFWRKLCTVNK